MYLTFSRFFGKLGFVSIIFQCYLFVLFFVSFFFTIKHLLKRKYIQFFLVQTHFLSVLFVIASLNDIMKIIRIHLTFIVIWDSFAARIDFPPNLRE